MRSAVVAEYLAEKEARPDAAYSQLRELAAESAQNLMLNGTNFVDIACPVCHSSHRHAAFERSGYQYWECKSCRSIYISPRPDSDGLKWYLFNSPIAEYRNRAVLRESARVYVSELIEGRADWITTLSQWGKMPGRSPILLYKLRHSDLANAVARRLSCPVCVVSPLAPVLSSTDLSEITMVNSLEQLESIKAQIVTAFDCLEHESNLDHFFEGVSKALEPGGLLALTTRAGSGFDIQALWEKLDTIFPLEHANLISVDGIRRLADYHGFDIIELSTPGQLDVQVVARVLEGDQNLRTEDRLLETLVLNSDESARRELQQFLQKHLLSSHMRVVARKRSEM